MNSVKKEIGIILCIVLSIIFSLVAKMLAPHFDGVQPYSDGIQWYIVSNLQRLLFGIIGLCIFVKIFKKESWTEVIHFKNFKYGLAASFVMFLVILFDIITYYIIGAKEWMNTSNSTLSTVVSCLFFQQLTTGFWEELVYRAFVIEGYYKSENKTVKTRLIYAFISFAIFGMLHVIKCDSLSMAVYIFITKGIWGFAFSAIYLYSHNILVAMLMHFITNIFLSATIFISEWNISTAYIVLNNYVYLVLLGIMFFAALFYLRKEPKG